jgi:hypothetical protein
MHNYTAPIADAFDSLILHLKARDVSLPRPISDFTMRRYNMLWVTTVRSPGSRSLTVADVTSRPSGASPSRSDKKARQKLRHLPRKVTAFDGIIEARPRSSWCPR